MEVVGEIWVARGQEVEVELIMPYHYYCITLFKKKQALKGPIFSTPSFHLLDITLEERSE